MQQLSENCHGFNALLISGDRGQRGLVETEPECTVSGMHVECNVTTV